MSTNRIHITGPRDGGQWEVSSGRIQIANGLSLSAALCTARLHRDGVESGLVTQLNRQPLPPRPVAHLNGGEK